MVLYIQSSQFGNTWTLDSINPRMETLKTYDRGYWVMFHKVKIKSNLTKTYILDS